MQYFFLFKSVKTWLLHRSSSVCGYSHAQFHCRCSSDSPPSLQMTNSVPCARAYCHVRLFCSSSSSLSSLLLLPLGEESPSRELLARWTPSSASRTVAAKVSIEYNRTTLSSRRRYVTSSGDSCSGRPRTLFCCRNSAMPPIMAPTIPYASRSRYASASRENRRGISRRGARLAGKRQSSLTSFDAMHFQSPARRHVPSAFQTYPRPSMI